MNEQRCATCKWWSDEPESASLSVRRCLRVLQWWDATEWDDDGMDLKWTAEASGVLAFADDGSSYRAGLLTRPEFGCVMWEGKP
jgi:hypothetical protein